MSSEYVENLRLLMLEKIKADRASLALKTMGWLILSGVLFSASVCSIRGAGVLSGLGFIVFFSAHLCDLRSEQVRCKIKSLMLTKGGQAQAVSSFE